MTLPVEVGMQEYASGNFTPEGVEVKVGQQWRDLDKRMKGRIRHIVGIADGKAFMRQYSEFQGRMVGQLTKVSIRRMKKSSTGWALVTEPTEAERELERHG